MTTLCIIPCGSKKVWDIDPNAGPTPAKQVYIGPFVKKCSEYAETFHPNSWVILSAKYGFLLPNDTVAGPYKVTFNDKNTNPISSVDLLPQLARLQLSDVTKVVVLGGRNYVKVVRQVFRNVPVETPLAGCSGIGYMLSRIKSSLESSVVL